MTAFQSFVFSFFVALHAISFGLIPLIPPAEPIGSTGSDTHATTTIAASFASTSPVQPSPSGKKAPPIMQDHDTRQSAPVASTSMKASKAVPTPVAVSSTSPSSSTVPISQEPAATTTAPTASAATSSPLTVQDFIVRSPTEKQLVSRDTKKASPDGRFVAITNLSNPKGNGGTVVTFLTNQSGTRVTPIYWGSAQSWSSDSKKLLVYVMSNHDMVPGLNEDAWYNIDVPDDFNSIDKTTADIGVLRYSADDAIEAAKRNNAFEGMSDIIQLRPARFTGTGEAWFIYDTLFYAPTFQCPRPTKGTNVMSATTEMNISTGIATSSIVCSEIFVDF